MRVSDKANLAAAKFGGSFRCCVCRKIHPKSDINDLRVYQCFTKLCVEVDVNPKFPNRYDKRKFPRPFWGFYLSYAFLNKGRSERYPLEEKVIVLAYPNRLKAARAVKRDIQKWRKDMRREEEALLETCELKSVDPMNGEGHGCSAKINDRFVWMGPDVCSFVMKDEKIGGRLYSLLRRADGKEIEWKSFKEPAKVLVSADRRKFFVSREKGVVKVPGDVKSIGEAESFVEGRGEALRKP